MSKKSSRRLPAAIYWLLVLVVVVALPLTATRLLLTHAFVWIEYHTPDFPDDSYGFTQEERLRYAPLALDFLLNDEDISFLADQTFEDGTPLYNARELSHMQDVKELAQAGLRVWYGGLLLLAAAGFWAWRVEALSSYRAALHRGGRITMYLIMILVVLITVSFTQIFVGFHRIFFEGDTWLFLFSDTLIRLFPIRFWRDTFVALGLLTLGGSVGVAYLTRERR